MGKNNELMPKNKLQGELRDIPIDLLVGMDLNPNVMSDAEFNRLTKELEITGFIDPIQVVPLEDGRYRIIGGHQRTDAARVLGYKTVPCVVLTDEKFKDADLQKFILMRLNLLRGKIDAEKFIRLYQEVAERYSQEVLQDLFAVVDSSEWAKLTAGVNKALKSAGISEDILEKYDGILKEVRAIDDLAVVLNKIFSEHGNELASDFMVFSYLGSKKKILYVQADEQLFNEIEKELKICYELGISANNYFKDLLQSKKQ